MPRLVITGANRGIGLAFVKSYLADGWEVIACCREPEKAKELQLLSKENGHLTIRQLDVADAEAIADFAEQLTGTPIDLLINNAGIFQKDRQALGDYEQKAFLKELTVNTVAPALMTQALLDEVKLSDKKTIVTISSQLGSIEDTSTGFIYYRSSKAAVNMIMHTIANEVADDGIKVIPVHPGWVQTDMGGPNAQISTSEAVEGLRRVIDDLSLDHSGRFYTYNGEELPW